MTYPVNNNWTGEAPEPQVPEIDAEYGLQLNDNPEQFGGMGTCSFVPRSRVHDSRLTPTTTSTTSTRDIQRGGFRLLYTEDTPRQWGPAVEGRIRL